MIIQAISYTLYLQSNVIHKRNLDSHAHLIYFPSKYDKQQRILNNEREW